MLIGIGGKKRSGKDTAANELIQKGFKRIALADPLKEICSKVFLIPLKCFHDDNLKDRLFIEPVEIDVLLVDRLVTELEEYTSISNESIQNLKLHGCGKVLNSPREILQFVGDDLCRACVKDSIWVDIFLSKIKSTGGDLVCTDARYPNERKLIKDLGGFNILLVRPDTETTDTHRSENSLGDQSEYDAVIVNDGSLAVLGEKVAKVINEEL